MPWKVGQRKTTYWVDIRNVTCKAVLFDQVVQIYRPFISNCTANYVDRGVGRKRGKPCWDIYYATQHSLIINPTLRNWTNNKNRRVRYVLREIGAITAQKLKNIFLYMFFTQKMTLQNVLWQQLRRRYVIIGARKLPLTENWYCRWGRKTLKTAAAAVYRV